MEASISERDAQQLARELYEAERKARSLQAKVRKLRAEVDGYDSIAAYRARLEEAISKINDLAAGASDRDVQARIRVIREIARSA